MSNDRDDDDEIREGNEREVSKLWQIVKVLDKNTLAL